MIWNRYGLITVFAYHEIFEKDSYGLEIAYEQKSTKKRFFPVSKDLLLNL